MKSVNKTVFCFILLCCCYCFLGDKEGGWFVLRHPHYCMVGPSWDKSTYMQDVLEVIVKDTCSCENNAGFQFFLLGSTQHSLIHSLVLFPTRTWKTLCSNQTGVLFLPHIPHLLACFCSCGLLLSDKTVVLNGSVKRWNKNS